MSVLMSARTWLQNASRQRVMHAATKLNVVRGTINSLTDCTTVPSNCKVAHAVVVKAHRSGRFPVLSSARPSLHRTSVRSQSGDTSAKSGGDVYIGKVFELRRVFTQKDVDDFARVTGDLNPMHQDSEIAKRSIFGGPVVHGMLVGSMFTSLIGTSIPGSIYRTQEFKFKAPVFPLEEVIARIQVLTIRESKTPGGLRMSQMSTTCSKKTAEGEMIVIQGEASCMIP